MHLHARVHRAATFAAAGALLALAGCASAGAPAGAPINDAVGQPVTTASGLKSECVRNGSGAVARRGDSVTVHYVGTLTDGTVFDSSRERDKPITFTLGDGMVIKGWDEGLVGMAVGCVRRLTIPPHLAYGTKGHPPQIPPQATLVFEIELIDVTPAP